MNCAKTVAIAFVLSVFAAPALLAQDQPACPPGGYGVASCPGYGSKSKIQSEKDAAAATLPPPQFQTPNDCLKAGWGIAQCQGFDAWWKSNQTGEAPAPPPAYKETNDCLKAGWGIAQCQGFDAWWKGDKSANVDVEPNPDRQHQGCGGFGTTECPTGGGGGGAK